MYEVRIKADFSAAHNLIKYRGKCERLHGHNWIAEAVFSYAGLDRSGMAVDFREAKKLLKGVLERFDHRYLNDLKPFKAVNPTSENIAKFIYAEIKKANKNLSSVLVWENANSCVRYEEG